MSRIAKSPIVVPADVDVQIDQCLVTVKGSKGSLKLHVHSDVIVDYNNNVLSFKPREDKRQFHAQAGTTRALINNMVIGVSQGFEKKLQLVGVGYRAQSKGKTLVLSLGYSHPVNYELPSGIVVDLPSQTEIIVKGVDKQLIGQVAAEIREFRRPEPYKGKGVRYADEKVRRKEAKKK